MWVMSTPLNRIVPEVGLSIPLMQLTKVVLPAPLGPITPRISPRPIGRRQALPSGHPMRSNVGEQCLQAKAPPPSRDLDRAGQHGHQPTRKKDDEQNDDQTEHGGVQLQKSGPNVIRK